MEKNNTEQYLDEFFNNLSRNFKPSKRDVSLDIPEIRIEDEYKEKVLQQQEEVSKNQRMAEFLGDRVPALNGCKTWGDIGKVYVSVGKESLKDIFFMQLFAGGVFLVMAESLTPSQKPIIGPWMIKTGYNNCKLLKQYTPQRVVEMFPEVDFEKIKGYSFNK